MDPNVIATIGSIVVIIVAALKIGGEIKAINARLDKMESEVQNIRTDMRDMRGDIRSINEHLRHPA